MSDQPSSLPQPGDVVDRYEVLLEIARGGMAVVYAARRVGAGGFDKLVALKVMFPNLASERAFVDMFLDEAKIASAVEHPNVVGVSDVGEHKGCPFIVMEFLRGRSLSVVHRAARSSGASLPAGLILAVLARAAEGLDAAHHTRGADGELLKIVHRDVSPQNIHVGFQGDVKLLDFGIAAARDRLASTRTGEIKGKLDYMAPEQVTLDRRIDHRADLFALGVVAWQLLAGRPLFRGESSTRTLFNVVHMPVPPLEPLAPDIPADAVRATMSCLERSVELRPRSAGDVAKQWYLAAEQLGFGSREAIGKVVSELLSSEIERDRERLAMAMAGKRPLVEPSALDASPQVETRLTGASELEASHVVRRSWRVALGVVLLAGVAAGAPLLVRRSPAAAPALPDTTVAPPIRVAIGPGVRLVLVDKVRHDERPVEIALGSRGSAIIELVSASGEIVSRGISREDDGRELDVPSAPAASTPAASSRPAASPTVGPRVRRPPARPRSSQRAPSEDPLLDNPFR